MPRLFASVATGLILAASGAAGDEAGGYYVGGLVGAGAGQSTRTDTNLPTQFAPLDRASTSPRAEFAPGASLLFGRDWRFAERWSAGLEAEASLQGAHGAWSGAVSSGVFGAHGSELTDLTSSALWSVPFQSALRARVAFAPTPGIWLYGGVGPALGYARLRATLDEHDHGGFVFFGAYSNFYESLYSRGAWTPGLNVDAGIEAALGGGFSFRAGYELTAFRPLSLTVAMPSAPAATGELRATPLLQSVRLGLVKRF